MATTLTMGDYITAALQKPQQQKKVVVAQKPTKNFKSKYDEDLLY